MIHPVSPWRRQLRYLLRYGAVSLGIVAAEQIVLFVSFGILEWSTTSANLLAFAVLTGPAYYLNRRWVWRGGGARAGVVEAMVPFLLLGLLGLVLSMWATAVVAGWTTGIDDREVRALFVNVTSLAAYGLVWLTKFAVLTVVFNRPPSDGTVRPPPGRSPRL